MHETIIRDAHAVLLPAFDDLSFGEGQADFFRAGGMAGLLGCSRAEYVARRMGPDRVARETADDFLRWRSQAEAIAGDVLVAADYELGGIQRLHRLGPTLGHPSAVRTMSDGQIRAHGRAAGKAALALGVNLVLAPVVDVVTGTNPWLLDRTVSPDATETARAARAYIEGLQEAGVAATAKHFPGYPDLPEDPFVSATTAMTGSAATLAPGLEGFRAAIAAGVKAVMVGPAPVDAIDPAEPASTSAPTVELLRGAFGFGGLVISDDLDMPGTMRGRPLAEVAVLALKAGAQLLLIDGAKSRAFADAIVAAVDDGRLPAQTVSHAAAAVRELARQPGG